MHSPDLIFAPERDYDMLLPGVEKLDSEKIEVQFVRTN